MIRPLLVAAAAALVALCSAAPASAQGDLLIAPTRLVLSGSGGGEVVVSNKGDRAATYRISLVLRRMDANGAIEPVDESNANVEEAAALDMLAYAPLRVTLAAQESRSVRIGVRAPASLPPGEYRAHLLFRAVPDVLDAATPAGPADGMSIRLTPVYGIAIPVIVRIGAVSGGAQLENAALVRGAGGARLSVDLVRTGNRSVYGDLTVTRDGSSAPLMTVKGIAAYPEIARRHILLPADAIGDPSGVRIHFTETDPAGVGTRSAEAVLTH